MLVVMIPSFDLRTHCKNTEPWQAEKMAGRKMKTRHGLIAILLGAIVGIGLVCDPDVENVS
jgi:hypothetical protein